MAGGWGCSESKSLPLMNASIKSLGGTSLAALAFKNQPENQRCRAAAGVFRGDEGWFNNKTGSNPLILLCPPVTKAASQSCAAIKS